MIILIIIVLFIILSNDLGDIHHTLREIEKHIDEQNRSKRMSDFMEKK